MGTILLWTQNRQQLPTVWKQTVKQSRLLRLQHPIKCNLNQASHLFPIPFGLCFPSDFGQSLVNPSSPRHFPNFWGEFGLAPHSSKFMSGHPNPYLQTLLPHTHSSRQCAFQRARCPPIPSHLLWFRSLYKDTVGRLNERVANRSPVPISNSQTQGRAWRKAKAQAVHTMRRLLPRI